VNIARPLAGKRILITRARHQAGRLAEALEALGAEVLRLPTIEIVPPETYAHLDAVLEVISGFDWLIVTSANGAAALADRMRFLGLPAERLQHLQVAAIGPATAVAVGRIGLKVSAMPDEYVAEAVVAMLKEKVVGRRVLLARAAVARDVIPERLRACGADIHVVEIYRTVIPADSIDQVRELFGEGKPLPDAVTFTSSSTVNNFFALLAAAKMELPQGLRAISIGPVTTRTLRQHNWEPAREASQYDIPGVVEACVKLPALSSCDSE
jgi:uroporphyrinogen-III synthase